MQHRKANKPFYNMCKVRYLLIFTMGLGILTFSSCENNPLKKVDVSESKLEVKFSRLDKDIWAIDFQNPVAASQQLYQKYGSFYCDYMELILQAAPCRPDSNILALEGFVNHPNITDLQNRIQQKFADSNLESFNGEFTEAIRRWNHYFPDSIAPEVVYMNSGLNFSAFSTDSVISVGLDFFLGPNDSLVKLFPPDVFPQYFKDDMREDYLVVNAMKDFCWAQCNKQDHTTSKSDLLSIIVHQGKVMYMLDAMLPEAADSTKMNWSASQMEWAQANEVRVWKELANQQVLFGTEHNKNKKWIDFAPFTRVEAIPQDSPPQLGIWMGWNMVRAYMKANPDVTLHQLLAEKDAKKFLNVYKPK